MLAHLLAVDKIEYNPKTKHNPYSLFESENHLE